LLFFFLSFSAIAQKTVTGKISNAKDGSPVGFATITVKGTNIATVSNADGTFMINLPAGKTTLIVSSVGFTTIESEATGGAVTVKLAETTSALDEIVVTGYTAQKKKDITGAVSVVNVKDIKQQPVGTGEAALQGHASGLTVITSGQPGAASDIRIRGNTTFFSNQPLIIIDGVQGGDLTNINVNDIESVQVLKDAAAAIYGVAGANGVIIITTRKGAGKPKVSYDGYYGSTTKGPGYSMATPQEEANGIWQQQINSGIANPSSKQYGSGATPVVPDYITPTGYTLCNCAADSQFVGSSLYNKQSYQITRANKSGTDWYDEITRNATQQSHNISVSSGSDKSSYYFSVNYLNQQGIADFQYLKRYAVRANTQFNIKNTIRIGENAYLYYKTNPIYGNQGEGSPFSVVFREDPIIPVYDITGINFAGTKSQDLGNAQNPYANIYRSKDNKNNDWVMTGNVFADVDFLKHFTAHTSFGGIVDNYYYYNFNYVGYENAEGNTGANSFTEGAGYYSNWTFTNTLAYHNIFGQHSINALVGIEAQQYYGRNLSGTRSNYFSENPNYWTLATGSPAGATNTSGVNNGGPIAKSSQFAKVEYAYAGKYLINGTIRRDGVSVFTPEQRYGYFPGVSAAWRISQEDFMKNITWLNDLKLRASWAKLGTYSDVVSTNAFNLYATRPGKSYYSINGSNTVPTGGFYPSNIGNPNTSWEGDVIENIGFDATLFNNKLDFSIDWYKKKVDGLLYGAQGVPYDQIFVGDAGLPNINIASNQNTGLDANATYHGTINKDLKFDITGIFTSYNSKILSIPGSGYFDGPTLRNVVISRNEQGHPLGEFYGYQVVGLFQSQDDITKSPIQDGARPGLFKYKDVDHNDTIDARDRTYIGNPNPKFTYGLNLSVTYKNFDFSAFFFGSVGNDIFNQTLYFTDFPDFFKGAMRKDAALNAWTPQHTNTSIPAFYTTGSFSSDQATNTYFISSGTYLRCKQMQIGYTFDKSILSKIGVDHLRVYVQGANLFTITNYNGLDPELQSSDAGSGGNTSFSVDQGNYPHTPAYLIGVNLTF
jgi:TonB-linked SusC/RagA family outer membrane protein